MPKSVWTTNLFWFYVELFHLLFYKYLYGVGRYANCWGAVTAYVLWGQQFIITDVRIWTLRKCAYTQRPTIIGQRKLK